MGQKIEVDPFLKNDIKEVLDAAIDYGKENSKACNELADKIIEKVAEFVNENYIPKP